MTYQPATLTDNSSTLPKLPGWVTSRSGETPQNIAFLSGASFALLDVVLQQSGGAIPRKLLANTLALKAAVVTSKLEGRLARETDIRDAYHLTPPGANGVRHWGPDGDVLAFWRDAVRIRLDGTDWMQNVADHGAAKFDETVEGWLTDAMEQAKAQGPLSAATHLLRVVLDVDDRAGLCRKLFVLDFDLWPCEMFSQYRVQGFMISFKGSHYPKDVILHAVFFYIQYAVSYRDLGEILAERGVEIDHATLNRWVVKYSPLVAEQAHRRKSKTCASWRVDETYIRVKGKWVYQYRAIDKHGKTLDFMLSERRDEAAARAFFIRSIANNGLPEKVVIDKSGSNLAGLNTINCCLFLCGFWPLINVLRVKYLNNIVEHTSRRYAAQTTAGQRTTVSSRN